MTSPATAPKKLKAHDRQELLSKVLGVLKKRYKTSPPKHNRPVLETLMFAVLLEDAPHAEAEKAFDSLLKGFFDLNEIRVSSVAEIEDSLGDLPDAGWRALRIREILQYCFEKFFAFDMEPLRRKTLDVSEKALDKIKYLTPFAREYTLLHSLGAHAIPLDSSSHEFLGWLGIATADNIKQAIDDVRGAVRKADVPVFLHLVHSMASDPAFQGSFRMKPSEKAAGGGDPATAVERLNSVLAGGGKKAPAAKTLKKPEKSSPPAASRPARKPAAAEKRKVAKAKPATKPVKKK
jgi:endonuclease-3